MDAPTPFASPHRWIQAKVVHTTIRSRAFRGRLVRQVGQTAEPNTAIERLRTCEPLPTPPPEV